MAGRIRAKRPSRAMTRFVAALFRPLGVTGDCPNRRVAAGGYNADPANARRTSAASRIGDADAPTERVARDAP